MPAEEQETAANAGISPPEEVDVAALEERLTRVERRPAGAAPATVAAQPAAAALPDYFAFEARMRGRSEEIRERQRAYVEDLREAAPVLDVGCGRGELVGLLHEAGVEPRGGRARPDTGGLPPG